MQKYQSTGAYILAILLIALFAATFMGEKPQTVKNISYSQMVEQIKQDKISSVSISGDKASAMLKVPDGETKKLTTVLPLNGSTFVPLLESKDIDVNVKNEAGNGMLSSMIGPVIFGIVLLLIFFMIFKGIQAGGSQAMSFGKSKAKFWSYCRIK